MWSLKLLFDEYLEWGIEFSTSTCIYMYVLVKFTSTAVVKIIINASVYGYAMGGRGRRDIHVREIKKEGRKKQARSNKQSKATQHTQGNHFSKEK